MSEEFNREHIYSQPSFMRGLARLIDFSGDLDKYKHYEEPDSALLAQDWQTVGRDIQVALERYGRQQ